MRLLSITLLFICVFITISLPAQQVTVQNAQAQTIQDQAPNTENIYTIKQHFLYNVLHNPNDIDNDEDNELARFNRWFHDVEVRAYPSGNLPRPDALIRANEALKSARQAAHKATSATPAWQPVGPMTVPENFNGIGRINCIVIDPVDTNTLYVGAACGGVFISHNGGVSWTSNSDNFPSLSIADIAVNPNHTDTIYAATGDGYGYEDDSYNDFWGGLYSAGVMMSADGGNTWQTTGLSYIQSNRDIIQRLLIEPNNPNILLAATRNGISRTTDAGATWTTVDVGHVYSMAFRPFSPDTVYAINNTDLKVSYDAGATWQMLHAGISPIDDRSTIGVSPVAPNALWVLDAGDSLHWSHTAGQSFITTNPPDTAHFYGYYDRVLGISPIDSTYILAFGELMAISRNSGLTWNRLNPPGNVHVDNHAVTFNPLHPATIYTGNDGGISVTRDGGATWTNLGNGLMISQIYRLASSIQNPYIMLCGLQDNGSFSFNSTNWMERTGGDGQGCAINPSNDFIQVASSQNGDFNISYNQGASFSHINVSSETAYWTAPVAFDPSNEAVIFFGYQDIFASYDAGTTFNNLTGTAPFANGATCLAVAPSNDSVIYAGDMGSIFRTTNAGATWVRVTGNLPSASVAITHIAVDYTNPMLVYVTTSGYVATQKVFVSTIGGTTWTSIGGGLPNLPANCVAVDSSTPGALFVGTDIGVYYTDSSESGWILYGTGLPNVIANDLDINYGNYKIRVATYGRGAWECNLVKPQPSAIPQVAVAKTAAVHVYPNPAINTWKIVFQNQRPKTFTVKVTDVSGRVIHTQQNSDLVNASGFAAGTYIIDITGGDAHYSVKAIRE